MPLHANMWARQQRALHRASPAASAAAAAVLEAARQQPLPPLSQQPSYVTGGRLFPHQLAGADWLRRQWASGDHAVLADDSGMGKTATVVAFLQCIL